MKPDSNKEVTQTKKVGKVTINPKKEDLMSESIRNRIQGNIESLREDAKKKAKHIKAAKAGKRWQDSDGDGKWYEPGEDVKKESVEPETSIDTTSQVEESKSRLRHRMEQQTIDHDRHRAGLQ